MKKRIAIITCITIFIALLAGCFIHVTAEKTVVIHASMFNTTAELRKPSEWFKWQPTLVAECADNGNCGKVLDSTVNTFSIKSPKTTLQVSSRGPIFTVDETGGHTASYVYTIIPSINDDSTSILIQEKQSLLHAVFAGFTSNPYPAVAIDSLKGFIETPAKYYGFNIEIKPVIDTNVVTITQKTVAARRAEVQHSMQAGIDGFITANGLVKSPVIMVHYQQKNNDSLEMMMGVPVNKNIKSTGNIVCMQLPKGRMVTAYYKGSFAGRTAVYKAVQRYMNDKLLRPIAVSYEKYLNNTLPENDNSQIEILFCAPVL